MEETWIYRYDPDTKVQSKQWNHSESSRYKSFRMQKSVGKALAPIFWDKDGITVLNLLEQGKTVSGAYYNELLTKLREKITEKR